jgi:hypothetical protein
VWITRNSTESRKVFQRRPHSPFVESFYRGTDKWRDGCRVGSERTVTDDLVARIGAYIRHRSKVEPNAELTQPGSRCAFNRADMFGTSGADNQLRGRREIGLDTVHLPTLLIEHDQDRVVQARTLGQLVQAVGERLEACGPVEVGSKQENAPDTALIQQRTETRRYAGATPGDDKHRADIVLQAAEVGFGVDHRFHYRGFGRGTGR